MKKIILIILFIQCSINVTHAQWIQQNSGTNQNLYDIEFINDKTGWAVGDAGVVVKTTNGGMNWDYVPNPSNKYNGTLFSIQPIDSNIIYFTSAGDLIIKSTNGGSNWEVLHFCGNCNSSITGLHFMNKDTGWFLGTNKVFRTYDGGNTLDSFYAPWFTNADIYFKDINTGIFCGDGRVFKSTNGGMNWFDSNVPTIGVFYSFKKLAVVNNNVWVSGSGNPPVYRSTDFCETWEVTDTIRNTGIYGLGFINNNTGFAGGGLNKLFKTTDGGFNWSLQQSDSNNLAFISSIRIVNDTLGWYCGGIGNIFKTINSGNPTLIFNNTSFTDNKDYLLYQNYPNPFNSETNIEFDIKNTGNVNLEIFDILGRNVSTLINKKLQPGSYEINYDMSDMNSGVYFYKLSTENFSKTMKMLLIK